MSGSISFVGGAGPTHTSSSTSHAGTSPASLANGDGLFAFLACSFPDSETATFTPPSGWTQILDLVNADVAYSSAGTRHVVWRKNTVVTGDSSTSFTFTSSLAVRSSLHYAAVRSSGTEVYLAATNTRLIDGDLTTSLATPTALTATKNGEMFLFACSFDPAAGSTSTSTPPTGTTGWTSAITSGRGHGAYQARDTGQSGSTASFSITNKGGGGFSAATSLVLRLQPNGPMQDTITDGFRLDPFTDDYSEIQDTLTESIATAFTLTFSSRPGAAIVDGVGVTDPHAVQWRLTAILADGTQVVDPVQVAALIAASEGIGVARALIAVQATQILLGLGLLDVAAPGARYGNVVADEVRLSPSLEQFLGGSLSDAIVNSDTAAVINRMAPALAETIGASDALTPKLFLSVTVPEALQVTDAQLLRMLFQPTIAEGVLLDALHIRINGDATTWVMNTATGAVTTYDDYVFTSFTRTGNRYLGASEDGLYLLDGGTDAGVDIIAALKTGLAQLSGSRFSGLKAVYLGVRGGGAFVLKVVDGEGVTRTYGTTATSMRTARIDIGKGIRTRYLSFELISAGQDFDLDSIEMIPLPMQRRV